MVLLSFANVPTQQRAACGASAGAPGWASFGSPTRSYSLECAQAPLLLFLAWRSRLRSFSRYIFDFSPVGRFTATPFVRANPSASRTSIKLFPPTLTRPYTGGSALLPAATAHLVETANGSC